MTLERFILETAIVAIVLTVAIGMFNKGHKSWLMTFLQNFCGVFFIRSGWVKAVDPLGTAYKMEQYFAEFESTFSETWLSFIAPIFPWFSENAIWFSVVMIVFEIVLGVMLIIGSKSKLTAWAFLLLVAFFTFLTGFTYLTGYVPGGVNFFEFGKWGSYVETNMKVTDCGCFGDYMKLKPKVSFLKDVFLMIPALFFVFKHKDMHSLFTPRIRSIINAVVLGGITLYCLSNYVWDLPRKDYRPFKNGVNIKAQKDAEEQAEYDVEIVSYKATNKADGKVVEIPYEQYLKEFKKYPKEEWDLEQIKTEPAIPRTKISDFDVSDVNGNEVTEDILTDPNYRFMIIAHKMKYSTHKEEQQVEEKVQKIDSLFEAGAFVKLDTTIETQTKTVEAEVYTFDAEYVLPWSQVVNPVLEAGKAAGVNSFAITAYADPAQIEAFQEASGSDYPFYLADDILLKTIVRSNPGVLLIKDGQIVQKWHYKKLPSFEEIKANFIK